MRRENHERGDRRCTVIFIGRRYEMLFWAIKEKKSPRDAGVEMRELRTLPERKTRCPGKRGCDNVVLPKTR